MPFEVILPMSEKKRNYHYYNIKSTETKYYIISNST